MNAIEIEALSKNFGAVRAVEAVSLTVEPGEIFGLMGHNGAGKTTLLRMLLGLTPPTAGRARVLGRDVATEVLAVRRLCGYLPADYALPPDMTARQFLAYVAAMFSIPRAEAEARAERWLARASACSRPRTGACAGSRPAWRRRSASPRR